MAAASESLLVNGNPIKLMLMKEIGDRWQRPACVIFRPFKAKLASVLEAYLSYLEESRNQKLVSTHGPGQQVWSWGGGSSFGDGVGGRQQRRTPRSVLGRRRLPWVVCDHALRRAPLLTLPRSLSSAMPYPFSAAPCRRLGGIHIAATATGIAGHGV